MTRQALTRNPQGKWKARETPGVENWNQSWQKKDVDGNSWKRKSYTVSGGKESLMPYVPPGGERHKSSQ